MFEITTIKRGEDGLYFLIREENNPLSMQHEIQGENVTLSDDGLVQYKLPYKSGILVLRFEADNPVYHLLLQVRVRDSSYLSSLENLLSKA